MEMVSEKFRETETKTNRESILRDFVRYAKKATSGLSTVAESEGRNVIHRMAQTGRISPDEEERLTKVLMSRMKKSQDQLQAKVETSIRKAAEKLAELSYRELARLTQKTEEIENRIDQVKKNNLRT